MRVIKVTLLQLLLFLSFQGISELVAMETIYFLGYPDPSTSKNIFPKWLKKWNVEKKMLTLEILKKPSLHTLNFNF